MPTTYTVENTDGVLNNYHMPSDLVLLIDGLVHRVMELSDNHSFFTDDEAVEGRNARLRRRGSLETGTYSSGTLRDEDMLIMFDTIGQMTKCKVCVSKAHEGRSLDQGAHDHEQVCESLDCTLSDDMRDRRSYIIEELFDHVNEEHTPEGFYFGSSEGDASDFGIWEYVEDVSPIRDISEIHKQTPQRETPDSRMFEVSVRYFTNNPDLTGEMVNAIAQEALESVLVGDDWYKYLKVVG